jgi:fructokinase
MRKIIVVGECGLDILFRNNQPVKSYPGGIMLNVAAQLGMLGHDTTFVSEAATDHVGDIITDYLSDHHVNTKSIDRFTEGKTATKLIFTADDADGKSYTTGTSIYSKYPEQCFDVVWPRIDHDDIVIFGGMYSIDFRVRNRLFDIIKYASERKAIIVYVPDTERSRLPRITKVMPSILENLEIADLVIGADSDWLTIFNKDNDRQAYADHISFYTFNFLSIDITHSKLNYFHRALTASRDLKPGIERNHLMIEVISNTVNAIIANNILLDDLRQMTPAGPETLLDSNLNIK